MGRKPQKIRAARAGLARGHDPRRLRRNASKQALSRLELGEGLELDSRSRLTVSSEGAAAVPKQASSLPLLKDDTLVAPSDFRISQITSTSTVAGVTLADVQGLQEEIEVFLEEIRENLATLTKRMNELTRMNQ